MPLILLRHASAGDRAEWDGDDRERPLDERGRKRARVLVAKLQPFPIDEIHTSPYVRCVQTVEPIASARDLEPRLRGELTEERQGFDGAGLLHELAGTNALVCGHGGLERALPDPPPKWRKGAALVLDERLRVVELL